MQNHIPFALPRNAHLDTVSSDGIQHATFFTFETPAADIPTLLGTVAGQQRHLAIARVNPWSLAPYFGRHADVVPDETMMLLWEKETGGYGVLIPLVQAGQRAWLAGTPDGLELRSMAWDRAAAATTTRPATLLFSAEGDDPFALVETSIDLISQKLRTFRTRTRKETPQWIDWFGWCTWDAFYQEVSVEGVLDGLEKARISGVPPRFLILDDGWQDTDGTLLKGFDAHPEKFPTGLGELIRRAKDEYDIQMFGIWHALQGYWFGVDPASPAIRDYRYFDVTQRAHNRPEDEPARRVLIHPDDSARFYHDYYRELRAAGVDFVKVDNQGSLDHFLNEETTPPTATMQRYQEAFQGAAAHHFRGETLHCLSQTGDALFHLDSGNVMRNSEDYFPRRPETQGQHVFRNALNNVFMRSFCLPDWDMFQSSRPEAAFHAAARAISGGPVYISDKPGEQNVELLRKLMTSDGRTLRCPQPAAPTHDSLFVDAYTQPHLFKIQNRNRSIGVLGLFNCHWDADGGQPVSGHYQAADVRELDGNQFACFHHQSGALIITTADAPHAITLPPLGWELITVAPIIHGVALFGLIDKLNGSAAILRQNWITPEKLEIDLLEGCPFALYLERPLAAARVGRDPVEIHSDKSGLARILLPTAPGITLTLEFSPKG